MRRLLKRRLLDAWTATIDEDYANRRINSERSLQAAFCARLASPSQAASQFLVVEPRVRLVDGRRVYPDVLICSARRVVAVIELKYLPRAAPNYARDVDKLQTISSSRASLQLDNPRYLGPMPQPAPFSFSKSSLFVWAGVYRSSDSTPRPEALEIPASLSECFFSLHALTHPEREPAVHALSA
ncbi:hypothetical protein [Botrimarina sp.]|uniref:hypothetical protein n=1 Tax=Botrimarina sp. TaxID=2795802 RepID=UPI0032EAE461